VIETKPIIKVHNGGSASIEFIPSVIDFVLSDQPEHGRGLYYNRDGKLSTIIFDSTNNVDLRNLPQDSHIPSDGELLGLFNAQKLTPEFGYDPFNPPQERVLTRAEAEAQAANGTYETGDTFFDQIFTDPKIAGFIVDAQGSGRVVWEEPSTAGGYEDLKKVNDETAAQLERARIRAVRRGIELANSPRVQIMDSDGGVDEIE
jgi:hypothetical protein